MKYDCPSESIWPFNTIFSSNTTGDNCFGLTTTPNFIIIKINLKIR